MYLVTTTPRTRVTRLMVWVVASLLVVFGSWLIGQGAWIHMKAVAAQWLLQRAWRETLTTQQPVKPWPWADTWAVGRLLVPRLDVNQIILADASGQSLAFGPGKVGNGTISDEDSPNMILSGHRDTHFSFVQDVRLGDMVQVQTTEGDWQQFLVEKLEVIDSRVESLLINHGEAELQLITCYPFDAVLPGGSLRYVVTARLNSPLARPQVAASARAGGGSMDKGMIVERG